MYPTKADISEKFRAIGLPPVFADIWVSRGPDAFQWHWTGPRQYFEFLPMIHQHCPQLKACIPLLESNSEHFFLFDEERREYVEYWYGDDYCSTIASSYQQFISWLFLGFVEAGLVDLIEEVASEFEYKHMESLRAYIDAEDGSDDARDAFLRSTL